MDGAAHVLMCYRHPVGAYPSYRIAKQVLRRHIWDCPEGPMPWARRVEFHRVASGWVTAARGEWLDHGIRVS